MSENIICSGDYKYLPLHRFHIEGVDSFLKQGSVWIENGKQDVWTFSFEGKGIDTIITEAQAQIQENVLYEKTIIYELLNLLLDNHVAFAMWYDTYTNDLCVCQSKEEVLRICYEQITDISGMCEVYLVSTIQ